MNTEKMPQKIAIIGAGLAGCYLAILLAKRGYDVDIYERLAENSITEHHSKRTFNLTFYHRGVLSLKKIGIWDEAKKILVPLEGSVYHPDYAEPIYTPFDYDGKPQYTVQRPDLLALFIKHATAFPNIRFHFNTQLISVNRWEKTITINSSHDPLHYDLLFGADGVNSTVRNFVQQGQSTTHRQENLDWNYKEVTISRVVGEKMGWRKKASHIIAREHVLLVAFPNFDNSFTMMVILPEKKPHSFSALTNEKDILNFLKKNFPKMEPAYPDIVKSILENPIGHFSTIYTSPWYYENFIALVGDAAHAAFPFYGQGMSAAFEDCLEIERLHEQHGANWEKIFAEYQETRKKSTDVLADISKDNFNKFLRHTFADYEMILDRADSILHKLFPKIWPPPLYEMVYNETIPFADIYAKHINRRRIARYLGITLAGRLLYYLLLLKEKIN